MASQKVDFKTTREHNLNDTIYFMSAGLITVGHVYGWTSEVTSPRNKPAEYEESIHYKVRYKSGSTNSNDWSSTTLRSSHIHKNKLALASEWFKKQGIQESEIIQYCLDDIREPSE